MENCASNLYDGCAKYLIDKHRVRISKLLVSLYTRISVLGVIRIPDLMWKGEVFEDTFGWM